MSLSGAHIENSEKETSPQPDENEKCESQFESSPNNHINSNTKAIESLMKAYSGRQKYSGKFHEDLMG